MRISTVFFLCLCCCRFVVAQSPVPAPAQQAPVLILGATAHLGNGITINNSAVAFEKGKLTLVADASAIRIDRTKYAKIFDASGKHVYPGFIATCSALGLVEVDAVRATVDFAETGPINPNARAIVAYNTDSDLLPVVRANGILMAQTTPTGGLVSGSSSIVQLDAWNWEDATYKADDGIHMNWPAQRRFGGFETGAPEMRRNEQYDSEIQELHRFFAEAQAYAKKPSGEAKNPRFEAMRGLFDKKQNLYIHTNSAKTIQEAVLFAERYGVRVVMADANDAWLVADFLKAHNVPVILNPTQRLPAREDEAVDQPFKTAMALHAAGVVFAFSADGGWRQFNLPFQAGQAVGFGLPQEAALSAITLAPARILGIDATCGSLESGKDATLFISEGDALDMRGSRVTAAFIQGREINLDNKHKQLNRRFEEKYKRGQ